MTRITGRSPGARRWTGRLSAVGLALFAQVAVVGVLRVAPADATTQSTWRTVSAGEEHTCAERDDAQFTLVCWGDNSRGELGFGTIYDRSSPSLPVPLPGSTGHWVQVATGDWHTCARNSGGSIYCWGSNIWGTSGPGHRPAADTHQDRDRVRRHELDLGDRRAGIHLRPGRHGEHRKFLVLGTERSWAARQRHHSEHKVTQPGLGQPQHDMDHHRGGLRVPHLCTEIRSHPVVLGPQRPGAARNRHRRGPRTAWCR